MSELLSCPFCGGEATVERIGKSGYFYVACNTAYCCDFGRFDTEAEAIAAWNSRADYHGYEQAAIEAWESIKAWNSRAERTCRIVKTWSDSDYINDWNYRCSECRGFIPVNERDPETGDVISAANYCPNCGAKVVGE